eukprot:gene61406-83989_t
MSRANGNAKQPMCSGARMTGEVVFDSRSRMVVSEFARAAEEMAAGLELAPVFAQRERHAGQIVDGGTFAVVGMAGRLLVERGVEVEGGADRKRLRGGNGGGHGGRGSGNNDGEEFGG